MARRYKVSGIVSFDDTVATRNGRSLKSWNTGHYSGQMKLLRLTLSEERPSPRFTGCSDEGERSLQQELCFNDRERAPASTRSYASESKSVA